MNDRKSRSKLHKDNVARANIEHFNFFSFSLLTNLTTLGVHPALTDLWHFLSLLASHWHVFFCVQKKAKVALSHCFFPPKLKYFVNFILHSSMSWENPKIHTIDVFHFLHFFSAQTTCWLCIRWCRMREISIMKRKLKLQICKVPRRWKQVNSGIE